MPAREHGSGFRFSPNTISIESAVYEAVGAAATVALTTSSEDRADLLMDIGQALVGFILHRTNNIGKLNESGIAVHEMFTSYVNAGFTEEQAMYLMGEIMKAMVSSR